ncbi:hypothetical protein [Listeria sp. PSOL-1]|uniref:hypothetical protein n=1 Tax=Listeria sp. PSOL-1 TaxID=1844999 RepID=UPI0013D094B5|nr:hypothetical protein [Listeria sp. PSOL-1]
MKKIVLMKKKYFLLVGSLLLLFCLFPVMVKASGDTNLPQTNEIVYKSNQGLNEEQIAERFSLIDEKYDEKAPFSKEDAEFIVHYANREDQNSNPMLRGIHFYKGTSSKSFTKSKTSMGVKVTFSGKISSHLNSLNPGDQWYSGKTTARINKGSSKVSKIRSVVSQNTYGLIGNGGTYIGLVHKSTLTSTTSRKGATVNYLDQKRKYSALFVTYTYTTTYVEVTTSSGKFNLYGI